MLCALTWNLDGGARCRVLQSGARKLGIGIGVLSLKYPITVWKTLVNACSNFKELGLRGIRSGLRPHRCCDGVRRTSGVCESHISRSSLIKTMA